MMKLMNDIFLKVLLNILKSYVTFTMIYLFYLKKMKIEKVEKLVAKLYDKDEYVIHITNLKQALNYGVVLKRVHRFIKFNRKAWLRPYIDISTDLGKK